MTGSCLCGAVRFEVEGAMRGVVLCHCTMCLKTHGHVAAYSAAPKKALRLTQARGLKWYASSGFARRGFCGECGASIFWERHSAETVSIAAGMLDAPTGLTIIRQLHAASASDYYEVDAQIPER